MIYVGAPYRYPVTISCSDAADKPLLCDLSHVRGTFCCEKML